MRQNFYMVSLYWNPDLNDLIVDCLLTSMAAVQAEDVHASFLIVGNLNGHHQEWLGSTTSYRHGVATIDFAIKSNLEILVTCGYHCIQQHNLNSLFAIEPSIRGMADQMTCVAHHRSVPSIINCDSCICLSHSF